VTRGRKAAPIAPGAVYGCWTVVGAAEADTYGRSRYVARAACCEREVVKHLHDLVKASPTCTHCRGRKPAQVQP